MKMWASTFVKKLHTNLEMMQLVISGKQIWFMQSDSDFLQPLPIDEIVGIQNFFAEWPTGGCSIFSLKRTRRNSYKTVRVQQTKIAFLENSHKQQRIAKCHISQCQMQLNGIERKESQTTQSKCRRHQPHLLILAIAHLSFQTATNTRKCIYQLHD